MMTYERLEKIAPVVVMGIGLLVGLPNMVRSLHYKTYDFLKQNVAVANSYDVKMRVNNEGRTVIAIGNYDESGNINGDQILFGTWTQEREGCEIEIVDKKSREVPRDKEEKGLVALASCGKLKEISRSL